MDTLITVAPTAGDHLYTILALLVGAYELVVRFIPTVKDYTIVGFIYRILDYLVENRANPTPKVDGSVQYAELQEKPRFKITSIFKRKK